MREKPAGDGKAIAMMLHFSSLTTARFQLMVTLLKLAWQDQNFLEVWRCAPAVFCRKCPLRLGPDWAEPQNTIQRFGRWEGNGSNSTSICRPIFPPVCCPSLLRGSVYLLLGAFAKGARLARIIDRVADHGNQL